MMGDRINCDLNCAYCNKLNEDVWFAPTCNIMTFICEKCKKINFITTDLKSRRIELVKKEDVYWAISNASNMMDDNQIKKCVEDFIKKLKT